MRKLLIAVSFLILANISAFAQFNSGSTGADGALDLAGCPDAVCYIQLPESGVLNYTTVNVPAGKTLKFRFNFRNTPAILLATGNVNIAGAIDVSAGPSTSPDVRNPGPGGFYGGSAWGGVGGGPGGGQENCHGKWIGPLSLTPIIGGSGGNGTDGPNGGGGSGALIIASTTAINLLSGSLINANGARWNVNSCSGSGGAVRLVANTLNIAGTVYAYGYLFGTAVLLPGVIRFEAQPGQISYTGTTTPAAVFGPVNPEIIPGSPPTLVIASIAGLPVPPYSAGRPDRIDLLIPSQQPDPLEVQIQGTNVPAGTEVQLRTTGGTATGCTLTGGPVTVTCSGSVSGLNRTGITTLLATAVYAPPGSLAKFNPKGKNHVAKIRLESRLGAKQKYVFLDKKGDEIIAKNLNPKFLQEFGM